MIEWSPVFSENQFEISKEYLFTDGLKIITARFNTPYKDKDEKVWYSHSTGGYVKFNFTHWAEINLP